MPNPPAKPSTTVTARIPVENLCQIAKFVENRDHIILRTKSEVFKIVLGNLVKILDLPPVSARDQIDFLTRWKVEIPMGLRAEARVEKSQRLPQTDAETLEARLRGWKGNDE